MQAVTNFNKMRIIALYIMSKNGISEENLNKLVTHAQLEPSDKQALLNLANLGLNVVVDVSKPLYFISLRFRHFTYNFDGCYENDVFRPPRTSVLKFWTPTHYMGTHAWHLQVNGHFNAELQAYTNR